MTRTCAPASQKVRLYGWDEWEGVATPVRAALFGHLVERAKPVVREFLSDLFHDAHWITTHVQGPTEFEWLARASGTNIGLPDDPMNSARVGVQIGAPGGVFYRVQVTEAGGEWWATFTRIPLDDVPPPRGYAGYVPLDDVNPEYTRGVVEMLIRAAGMGDHEGDEEAVCRHLGFPPGTANILYPKGA